MITVTNVLGNTIRPCGIHVGITKIIPLNVFEMFHFIGLQKIVVLMVGHF